MNTERSLVGRYKTDTSEKEKDELYFLSLRVGKMCASSNIFFFPFWLEIRVAVKKIGGGGLGGECWQMTVCNLIQKPIEEHYTAFRR